MPRPLIGLPTQAGTSGWSRLRDVGIVHIGAVTPNDLQRDPQNSCDLISVEGVRIDTGLRAGPSWPTHSMTINNQPRAATSFSLHHYNGTLGLSILKPCTQRKGSETRFHLDRFEAGCACSP